MRIVKFSCDCKAIWDEKGKHIIIAACDRDLDSPEVDFWEVTPGSGRDFKDKTHVNVSEEEKEQWVTKIGKLIFEGYKFRAIKEALR